MKPRTLALLAAAVVILLLVAWRTAREGRDAAATVEERPRQLAPRFELYDQRSRLVKFERYLGRTELLVVFFDGAVPADEQPLLMMLQARHEALAATGLEVIAISPATPHAVREAEGRQGAEFSFPVLTDIDLRVPTPVPVHRQWGLADDESARIRSGAFHVDRGGRVTWEGRFPSPLGDPIDFLAKRLGTL